MLDGIEDEMHGAKTFFDALYIHFVAVIRYREPITQMGRWVVVASRYVGLILLSLVIAAVSAWFQLTRNEALLSNAIRNVGHFLPTIPPLSSPPLFETCSTFN